ncbi:MAG TPA: aminoacyl-tRNA deacylase [Anaerolineae bacterium]|nr:aminoacyl-tRNA deacylase [Anaerolineae bacterium]
MAKKVNKTLAMKVLDGRKISYEVVAYPGNMRDAEEIAQELGVPPGQVFKTLVALPPEGYGRNAKPILAVIPANRQLNLKKLAKLLGVKKVKMASHKEAEALTGLQVGGISPLALLNKGFLVYLDTAAKEQTKIYISAGQRGWQIKLDVPDLVKVAGAKWGEMGD